MTINYTQITNLYICLYADCIPVRGAQRSSICDLTRGNIFLFQSEYFEILEYLITERIGRILEKIESNEEQQNIKKFIELLYENEFITFRNDQSEFPAIKDSWESQCRIQNAIIDIDHKVHDFEKIFNELDNLGCEFVQLRIFSDLIDLDELTRIISLSKNKSIESIEIIIKHNISIPDKEYILFLENEPSIVNLTLHSSLTDRIIKINYELDDSRKLIFRNINIVSKNINSHMHCGIISIKNMTPPSTATFLENKLRNGCLNGKVSIDYNGEIKNCPSMKHSFGNINEFRLNEAIEDSRFQTHEYINKDQIKVCKDCEFRYVCSDCRAFLEVPNDIYSKPLKCGYNPYVAEWSEWHLIHEKKYAIQHYGFMF